MTGPYVGRHCTNAETEIRVIAVMLDPARENAPARRDSESFADFVDAINRPYDPRPARVAPVPDDDQRCAHCGHWPGCDCPHHCTPGARP